MRYLPSNPRAMQLAGSRRNGMPAFLPYFASGVMVLIAGGMLFTGSGYAILSGAPGNVVLAFGLDQ